MTGQREDLHSQGARRGLVSCVICFLNGEEFIADAIDSVLAQTHRNWELIVVDDGSTDDAGVIAQEYRDADPERIRYITHPGGANRGPGASRDAGLSVARGELVAFLDVDDIWLPERLEAHVEIFGRNPDAGIVIGPTVRWWSWSGEPTPWWRPWAMLYEQTSLRLAEDELLPAPSVATHVLRAHGAWMPPPCCVTMRRAAIDALGGRQTALSRSLYEDQVLFFKMFLEYPAIFTGRALDKYRQHSKSAVATAGDLGDRRDRPVFLNWLREWADHRGMHDSAFREALASEISWAAQRAVAPPPRGRLHNVTRRCRSEGRSAAIWMLTPERFYVLQRRFGL